jgi:hypothetical protein
VPRLINEFVPGLAAVVDDVVVGCEDAVGEPVGHLEELAVFGLKGVRRV